MQRRGPGCRAGVDGHVEQALREFEFEAPSKPCHVPLRHTMPKSREKVQFVTLDKSTPLSEEKIAFVQRVVGKLLHCARAVDQTMLHAINDT